MLAVKWIEEVKAVLIFTGSVPKGQEGLLEGWAFTKRLG